MKILHVEGGRHLYGGALQALYLMRGLAAAGHVNLLACPRGGALGAAAADCAEVHGLPMHGDADPLMTWRLGRLIRATRPDLIHLHSRIGADVMGGLAGRLAGRPVVHTRRVDNPEPRWLVALKYRLHDRVIAISEGIGRVLLAEGLPPAKLRIVRSAVDRAAYDRPCLRADILDRLGLDAGSGPLIGVVAQLIPRKGHRLLFEALTPLLSADPGCRLLVLGQGPLAEPLRAEAAAAGLGRQIRFAGFRADLADILPCLDLLAHPALMEGLGVSLLQAASAGVPIVASRVGGIPEAVRDGETGLLVPPGEVGALREALAALLGDPARRRALGAAGRRLMAREFSIETMVAGNLAVYRELSDAP